MSGSRAFLNGFLAGLLVFLLANLLAAHLHSDCGLPAVFGWDPCADDIARAGFPFIFFEEGGFVFRSIFNLPYLLLDLFLGFGMAVTTGWAVCRLRSRKSKIG
jgi:hypothetical protein